MKRYQTKVRFVEARVVTQDCTVECYNGPKIAFAGDYVIRDYFDRVVVIRKKKFERMYEEVRTEQK